MTREKLIELVRNHSCLYDTSNEDYKNVKLKDVVWESIGKELNTSASIVKSEWKRLRDCHRDAIKRRKLSRSGQEATLRPWKYEDQMNFLVDFMRNRVTETYVEVASKRNALKEVGPASSEEQEEIESTASLSPSPSPVLHPTSFKPMRNDKNELLAYLHKSIKDREKRRKDRSQLLPQKDALDSFFEAMCLSTKNLPSKYQLKVKIKIFQVVTEAEGEAMLEMENIPSQAETT